MARPRNDQGVEDQERPVTQITRIWLHPPFLKALARHDKEPQLLEKVFACVETLRANPRNPGLNFEFIKRCGKSRVFSARIDRSYRLAVVELGRTEAGLLYFDNHDQTYSWIDHNQRSIPTMLSRVEELKRGSRPSDPQAHVRASEEDSIAVPDVESIRRMLHRGMAGYLAYLDDSQRSYAEIDLTQRSGLTLIKGGAGTGKTAVAIARVRHLATTPEFGRVLYLCYNRTLAATVGQILDSEFGGHYPRNLIEVSTIHHWCRQYMSSQGVEPQVVAAQEVYPAILRIQRSHKELDSALSALEPVRIHEEINQVLRPNGFTDLSEYSQLERKGFEPLKQPQRGAIWKLAQELGAELAGKVEFEEFPGRALELLKLHTGFVPYRSVVLDEAQDCSPVMIRLTRQLVGGDERRLFVLADPAQSIYRNGFYWTQRELQPRGRQVNILRTTYRTTRQVQALAVTVFGDDQEMHRELAESAPPHKDGPVPDFLVERTPTDEATVIANLVASDLAGGPDQWLPEQVAVLAPSYEVLNELAAALKARGVTHRAPARENKTINVVEPTVKLLTLHSAKGLDFPVVYLCGLNTRSMHGDEMTPGKASQLYVGITRSGFKLTLSTNMENPHPLLRRLARDAYDLSGSAAATFTRWLEDVEG